MFDKQDVYKTVFEDLVELADIKYPDKKPNKRRATDHRLD